MSRPIAMFAAVLLTTVVVSASCQARTAPVTYSISKASRDGNVQIDFASRFDQRNRSRWGQGFAASDLRGLDLAALRSAAPVPARFSIIRDAGRLDCVGTVGRAAGKGECDYAANPAFDALLAANGIARPTLNQGYSLTLSGVKREVVETLVSIRAPRPTVDQLVALGIFRITPEYIRSFAAVGYRDLAADKLVEMKIFNVTAADVSALRQQGVERPTAQQLVHRRIFGGREPWRRQR